MQKKVEKARQMLTKLDTSNEKYQGTKKVRTVIIEDLLDITRLQIGLEMTA
ncbi:hypothetical protein GOV14_03165 [Candidatus Pacearchaeota archaeon]|nr:hypothetical protein [Candidatus Pacearchaeota archaeon]